MNFFSLRVSRFSQSSRENKQRGRPHCSHFRSHHFLDAHSLTHFLSGRKRHKMGCVFLVPLSLSLPVRPWASLKKSSYPLLILTSPISSQAEVGGGGFKIPTLYSIRWLSAWNAERNSRHRGSSTFERATTVVLPESGGRSSWVSQSVPDPFYRPSK